MFKKKKNMVGDLVSAITPTPCVERATRTRARFACAKNPASPFAIMNAAATPATPVSPVVAPKTAAGKKPATAAAVPAPAGSYAAAAAAAGSGSSEASAPAKRVSWR
jgi:hypothetical protein